MYLSCCHDSIKLVSSMPVILQPPKLVSEQLVVGAILHAVRQYYCTSKVYSSIYVLRKHPGAYNAHAHMRTSVYMCLFVCVWLV